MMSRLEATTKSLDTRNGAEFSFEFLTDSRILSIREHWLNIRAEIRIAGGNEEYKSSFQFPISKAHGLMSTLPFRFDSAEFDLDQTINQLLQRSKNMDPESSIKRLTTEVCKLLIELLWAGENPMLDAISNSLDSDSLVVIKESRWATVLQTFLKLNTDYQPHVVNVNRLADVDIAEKMLYLGSPTLLAYQTFGEPDTRFLLDPKASKNHFIMYPYGNLRTIPGIIDSTSIGRILSYDTPIVLGVDHIDWTPTEWGSISSRKTSVSSETEISEPARFVGLAGGNHIWISAKPDSRCRVLSLSRNGDLGIEVRQTSELREGEMIVERIGKSSPNLIDSVADGLGAKKYRDSQRIWKEALQRKIGDVGNLKAVERILKSDFNVDVSNLRHWAYDPRSIAPASRSDFLKACTYLGLSDSSAKLWKDLAEVRSLHLRAGNEISRRLQEAVLKLSVDQIRESDGVLLIHVEDCGSLGIFQIEHCSDEVVTLPISEIDVVTSNIEAS